MTVRLEIVWILILALMMPGISACSKDSNPAVPPAPENDVISTVTRNPMVRVGLLSFTPQKYLYISISRGQYKCFVGESLQEFADGFSGATLKFTGDKDTIKYSLAGDGDGQPLNNKLVRIEAENTPDNGYIMIGTSESNLRPYRGTIRIILEGKNLLAVNYVPLEDYLIGVVPAEMNSEWPDEALKSQAIVSRTWALFNMLRYNNRGFDFADDARTQKYGGVSVETEKTTEMTVQTVNLVVTYEEKLAVTPFHFESGGQTASNLDVWPESGEIPYLAGMSDMLGTLNFGAGGQYETWTNQATFEQLRTALNAGGETFAGAYLSSLTVLNVSENGRVQMIDVLGEKNPVVDGMTFINTLNRRIEPDFLPSNEFTMAFSGTGYSFTGSGRGHGVGMSQWGAKQRADNNQGYEFIIGQYYPGCMIREIPLAGIDVVHNTRIDMIR